jgi:hypothetical protein
MDSVYVVDKVHSDHQVRLGVQHIVDVRDEGGEFFGVSLTGYQPAQFHESLMLQWGLLSVSATLRQKAG